MLLRRVWLPCGLMCALILAGCGVSSGAAVAPTATTRPTPRPTASPTAPPQAATLYLGVGQSVYALDLRTGAKKWTYHTGQPEIVGGAYQAVGDVTVADGNVYFLDEADSSMYALSAMDGSLLWKVGGVTTTEAYITVMSNVVIASSRTIQDRNTTTAVDPHSGTTLWTQPMGASGLLPGDGVIYEARVLPGSDAEPVNNGTLKALNPTTGAVLWQLTGHPYGLIGQVGNELYASAGTTLLALNPQTGAQIWSHTFVLVANSAFGMMLDGTTIYITNGGSLYAMSGVTHAILWQAPNTGWAGVVPANGTLCSSISFTAMAGYDATTGAQKWRLQRPNGYAAIVSDGGLCIATGFGPETPIVAVDAQTGAVRWSYAASISYVRKLTAGGTLFVLGSTTTAITTSDSILRAVSEKDGSVLWTFDTQDHLDGSMALG